MALTAAAKACPQGEILGATPFHVAIRSDVTQLELPRERNWIEPTLQFLAKRCKHNGVRNDLAQMRLTLACREALEQAMRRQPVVQKPLRVTLSFEPQRCALAFADERPWLEQHRLADSTERPASVGRRRLNLIRTLVDEFELADQGKTLLLKVRRAGEQEPVRPSAIPFVNPVEVFPLQLDGCIDYDMAYQAIFRDVTDASITLLQQTGAAPKKACVGVYGAGRLYFLPVKMDREEPLSHGLKEVHYRIAGAKAERLPQPRLDAPFEEAQIVHSLKTIVDDVAANPASAKHRRAHERVVFSDRKVRLLDAPDGRPVFARDFSIGGLALISTFPLQINEVRLIELGSADGAAPTQLRLRIVRCMPLIDEFYDVGGEFVEGEAEAQSAS